MAGPSPKRLCILSEVSGVRIKSRLEMFALRSFGFPGELCSLRQCSDDFNSASSLTLLACCAETLLGSGGAPVRFANLLRWFGPPRTAAFGLRPSVERTSIFSLRENAIAQEPGSSYPESWRCASRLGALIGGAGSCEPSP